MFGAAGLVLALMVAGMFLSIRSLNNGFLEEGDVWHDPSIAYAEVPDFEVGDCVVTSPPTPTSIDCRLVHEAEVIGNVTLGVELDSAPMFDDLLYVATTMCELLFPDYVGIAYWDSIHAIGAMVPDATQWREGERTIVCLVYGESPSADRIRESRE